MLNEGLLYAPVYREKAKEAAKTPLACYPYATHPKGMRSSLDGLWDFSLIDAQGKTRYEGKINVPYAPEVPLSLVNLLPEPSDTMVYERKIFLPKAAQGLCPVVKFEGVDMYCEVYFDEVLVGTHEGAYVPFSVDLSKAATGKAFGILKVIVKDLQEKSSVSTGKQALSRGGIYYTTTSGIYQPVFLSFLPKERIKHVFVKPDLKKGGAWFKVNGTVSEGQATLEILGETFAVPLNAWTFVKPKAEWPVWDPSHPTLIPFKGRFGSDEWDDRFGYRSVETYQGPNGPVFSVNGKPVFLKAVLDQGYYWMGGLTPASEASLVKELKDLKSFGFNAVRVHMKTEITRFYDLCDEMGFLVIQDMPAGGATWANRVNLGLVRNGAEKDDRDYALFGREDEHGRKHFEKQMIEIIASLMNDPSVIMFTIFNEGWGEFDSARLYEKAKEYDNTRLYDTCSGWFHTQHSDVNSWHCYFFLHPKKDPQGKRPYFLSECGRVSYKVKGHYFGTGNFLGIFNVHSLAGVTKGYRKLFERHLIPLTLKDGLAGYVYTQVSDIEDELSGIWTYDRAVQKIETSAMVEENQKIDQAFEASLAK